MFEFRGFGSMLKMGAFVGVLVGGVVAPRKKGTEEFSDGKNLRPLFSTPWLRSGAISRQHARMLELQPFDRNVLAGMLMSVRTVYSATFCRSLISRAAMVGKKGTAAFSEGKCLRPLFLTPWLCFGACSRQHAGMLELQPFDRNVLAGMLMSVQAVYSAAFCPSLISRAAMVGKKGTVAFSEGKCLRPLFGPHPVT